MKQKTKIFFLGIIIAAITFSCAYDKIEEKLDEDINETNYTVENSFEVRENYSEEQSNEPEEDLMIKLYREDCQSQGGELNNSTCRHLITGDEIYIQGLTNTLAEKCILNKGKWLSEFFECEGISEDVCLELKGEFNSCGSACRNNPNATICTKQCVIFCSFN